MDNVEIFVYIFYFKSFWLHSIVSNSSTWFIKSNRFRFYEPSRRIRNNRMGETPSTFFLDSQITFHRNTHRIRGEFNKNTGKNSLWIIFKNLVCNGALTNWTTLTKGHLLTNKYNVWVYIRLLSLGKNKSSSWALLEFKESISLEMHTLF